MKGMLSAPDIYLYRESVDFRKSINGLAAIIENDIGLTSWQRCAVPVYQ
ncbi:IS66 family insertion sequence element accessory protein TnpB [Vibrio anguillarum]